MAVMRMSLFLYSFPLLHRFASDRFASHLTAQGTVLNFLTCQDTAISAGEEKNEKEGQYNERLNKVESHFRVHKRARGI